MDAEKFLVAEYQRLATFAGTAVEFRRPVYQQLARVAAEQQPR